MLVVVAGLPERTVREFAEWSDGGGFTLSIRTAPKLVDFAVAKILRADVGQAARGSFA